MNYFFQFGFSPSLARRELAAVLTRSKIKFQKTISDQNYQLLTIKKPLNHQRLIQDLAGTVRIAKQIAKTDHSHLESSILSALDLSPNKIVFSLNSLENNIKTDKLANSLKTVLANSNKPARFINPKEGFINPAHLQTHQIQEFILKKTNDDYLIYQTIAVSNSRDWQLRDRNRSVDAKSGILPPKVARMMLNIASPNLQIQDLQILDPFCGSGTILVESAIMGAKVIGIDHDPLAITNSQSNLEWAESVYHIAPWKLILHDSATIAPPTLSPASIDLIVTEGYLGPSTPPKAQELDQLIFGLEKLHRGVLLNIKKFLKPGANLLIALPNYSTKTSVKSLDNLIDTCENSGYTLLAGPIQYSQPKARVKRAIYLLQNNQ